MVLTDGELVDARVDTGTGFRHWSADGHQPEAEIWTGPRKVRASLVGRTADGTLVLSAASPRELRALADRGRLALTYRGDGRAGTRPVPLFTDEFTVDHRIGTVEASYPSGRSAATLHELARPIPAAVASRLLFRRSATAEIVALSPYGGAIVTADPGRRLAPGMAVTLDAWTHWLGAVPLRVQLTACTETAHLARLEFRLTDRSSAKNAALILAGSADRFTFADLAANGIRPDRLTRHLRIRTVADESDYRKALALRLVGNQRFGRLAGKDDIEEVADRLDAHSAVFICELGDKPVGTGRVVVNDGKRELSEIETETEGLPEQIWRGGFVEISRLAIHPDYSGAGVAVALFREIGRLGFVLNSRYLVLDAIDKLVPAYERIGAERLGIDKSHPYSGEPVRVMAIDIGGELGRLGRRWPRWQYLFGPVLKHQFTTSSSEHVADMVAPRGRPAFALKRLVSRLL